MKHTTVNSATLIINRITELVRYDQNLTYEEAQEFSRLMLILDRLEAEEYGDVE